MKTLTFTDEEWEYVEAFMDAPIEWWRHMVAIVRAANGRPADAAADQPPVVDGHDTVWLMAHEG